MNKLTDWINDQLALHGWGYNELARRAGLSKGTISNVMAGRQNPGYELCIGVARAFGEPPENVMRMAGLLPSLPPEVEEEREAIQLFRRLDLRIRESILQTMRNLRGVRTAPQREVYASAEENTTYEAKSLRDRIAEQLARDLETMHPDDAQRVLDLMERLRGDRTVPGGEKAVE